jgi:hypothetical protein
MLVGSVVARSQWRLRQLPIATFDRRGKQSTGRQGMWRTLLVCLYRKAIGTCEARNEVLIRSTVNWARTRR